MFLPAPLPRTLEASVRDLSSEKAQVRGSAIRDLVRHARESDETRARAIPLLEKALKDDAPGVRSAAAIALADLRAHEALAALLVAVEDADGGVRQMALNALGEIGDGRALARLERALTDDRAEMRYQAVIAYARVARERLGDVAAALVRALSDDDGAIRYIALRVAEENDGHPLDDERLVARAKEMLSDQEPALAVVAAIYLGKLGHDEASPVLLRVVRREIVTPEGEDEQAAIELAGERGLRDAVPDLERRAWGLGRLIKLPWFGAAGAATCAWHAKIALAHMGHPRATAEILRDLGSWRRETREGAVVAAGRARLREARDVIAQMGDRVDAALAAEALERL
jgi:HEAT repeat protein